MCMGAQTQTDFILSGSLNERRDKSSPRAK
jgi:hypothetical protein